MFWNSKQFALCVMFCSFDGDDAGAAGLDCGPGAARRRHRTPPAARVLHRTAARAGQRYGGHRDLPHVPAGRFSAGTAVLLGQHTHQGWTFRSRVCFSCVQHTDAQNILVERSDVFGKNTELPLPNGGFPWTLLSRMWKHKMDPTRHIAERDAESGGARGVPAAARLPEPGAVQLIVVTRAAAAVPGQLGPAVPAVVPRSQRRAHLQPDQQRQQQQRQHSGECRVVNWPSETVCKTLFTPKERVFIALMA